MKAVNVNDVLKILHKYGTFIFVTDSKKYSDMENEIANLPSVTPKQKVVRCKDCKHRDPETKKCDCGCWHFPFVTEDDDFCSYGETKMEGESE